jgi:hypothetical protein
MPPASINDDNLGAGAGPPAKETSKRGHDVRALEARKNALRRYVVFRIKAIEFLDLLHLYNCLRANSMRQEELFVAKQQAALGLAPLLSLLTIRPPKFTADSLRTVVVSWFALFIDKNGMDAIKLWCQLFPQYTAKTEAAWRRMEPAWGILREFRDCAGFHADTPAKFFGARLRFRKEISTVEAALKEFETLFKFFLTAEKEEFGKELEPTLDSLLDDLEKQQGGAKYQRAQFKAYLMIPNAPTIG